ncbi:MAG: hypothetical protein WCK67_10735 [bacterium]
MTRSPFTTNIKTQNKIEEKIYTNKTTVSRNNEINSLNLEDTSSNHIRNAGIISRTSIPETHRRIADSFMIIKKIFGQPVIQARLTENEEILLAKYDFNPLKITTQKQMEEELTFLKKWSQSWNNELRFAADKIIDIRSKELKSLIATNYRDITGDVYTGYKVLERYFESISKYANER